jgi:hypothetical protein
MALQALKGLQHGEWILCQRSNGNVTLALWGGLHFAPLGPFGVLVQPWIRSQRRIAGHRNAMRFLRQAEAYDLHLFGVPAGREVARAEADHNTSSMWFHSLKN